MTIQEMLGQSGLLTLLGMGVVFSFLIIMIICMYILHGILHALKLDKDAPAAKTVASPSTPTSAPAASPASTNDQAVIAAIAAAVHDKELNS